MHSSASVRKIEYRPWLISIGPIRLMSSTAVDLNLLGTGKSYKMGFAPRVSVARTFFSEEPDDWSYFPSGTLLLSKWTKLTTYDLVASHSRSEASSNELVEGLITEDEGEQLVSVVHELT